MTHTYIPVLIAGIGGASLGTEILKCLRMVDRYAIYGCDISAYAYGHYDDGFVKTFLINRERYVESIRRICVEYGIKAIIPGGEEPLALLGTLASEFEKLGILIAANSPEVITTCTDKWKLFRKLEATGIPVPKTALIQDINNLYELEHMPYPCIVKPTTGTGGSHLVFLAKDPEEARLYLKLILANRGAALVQEYIPLEEGEFSVGVLSLSDGSLVASIAMRRLFHTKLSVSRKTKTGLISSGYSQGLIDDFPEIRLQAKRIPEVLGSVGPMNIQGRVRKGILLPFEINPRFSASTYLRALAGFNEVVIYLNYILNNEKPTAPQIRPGYYLRSLYEVYVPKERVKR